MSDGPRLIISEKYTHIVRRGPSDNMCIKPPGSHPFSLSLSTPKTGHILPLANVNPRINFRRFIIDPVAPWTGNNLIINHLVTNMGIGAAFYSVMASFKIDFKCNIYDCKPFLTDTESITY